MEKPRQADTGVQFAPGEDGRRSTATTGRAVWAASVAGVDPNLSRQIGAADDWRSDYLGHVVAQTAAATRTPEAAVAVARAGLAAMADGMRFEQPDGSVPLAEAVSNVATPPPSRTVTGTGERERELVVPYRGQQLKGDALRRQLEEWVATGSTEPSFATAIGRVMDEPGWLDLDDRSFALLGAGAELGPLAPLLSWGAHVVALDVPSERVWGRILGTAERGSGRVTLPEQQPGTAGIDLLQSTPEAAAFLREAAGDRPMTVGSYAYADGARHVQLAHASDALVEALLRDRPGTGYAELATPTDTFAVPAEVVEDSARRWASRGVRSVLQRPARLAHLYRPAYDTTVERPDGSTVGIADVLVPQQGPNYTLAKRLQRWRAVAAAADGHDVSVNVAPATSTRSVTKNRLLAAAYAGARRFGVEVFEPATSRVLMAAMLVHDLRAPQPATAHPDDLFCSGAAHGGLWRIAYVPRSVLGIAAAAGLPSTVRRRT